MLCMLILAAATRAGLIVDGYQSEILVVGMQMESPTETQVLSGLDKMIQEHPQADLLLLSEYTFEGPVPSSVREWCASHGKHLMAGGRDPGQNAEDFHNTIFVVSPAGEIIFQQAKVQPIPFFKDGLPAETQEAWDSPWGRLGIAICYDMSYSRVMDPLVKAQAEALIIPAVDVITWGEWQHRLHAKIAVVRAREYHLPLFRLASSGISTFTDRNGEIWAEGTYPGHGEILAAPMFLGAPGRLPLDRYLAMPITVGMGLVLMAMVFSGRKKKPA
jgi:apolipoprotein N-acyltransferase